MTYTKTQLIDAFCEATNYNEELDGTKAEFLTKQQTQLQNQIDLRRTDLQASLDNIPATAKEQMKKIALEYLANINKEQLLLENSDVTI